MRTLILSLALGALAAAHPAAHAVKLKETVKIAWIDPQTGPMAPVGNNFLRGFQYFTEKFNASNPAGVKFEIIYIDNKSSQAESLTALKSALDKGVRYVAQGAGSAVAEALMDAVNQYNEHNPGHEVLLLNYGAADAELTNSKCSYWHFRFDADTSMKMEAMTTFMKDRSDVQKVYLLNQNYAHGQQVARFAKDMLARKRPDVQIVGDELHPLMKVRDFGPYIAKIKASGADTVITGDWGSDLSQLVKAAKDGGYDGNFYTDYASFVGVPLALGHNGEGRIYQIASSHYHMGGRMDKWMKEFNYRFNSDFTTGAVIHMYTLLSKAIANARSSDPLKVAAALEGLKVKSFNGEVEMRRADHQLQQPLTMTVWQKVDAKYSYSVEKTGMTFAPLKEMSSAVSSTPTTCQMKRPTAG